MHAPGGESKTEEVAAAPRVDNIYIAVVYINVTCKEKERWTEGELREGWSPFQSIIPLSYKRRGRTKWIKRILSM